MGSRDHFPILTLYYIACFTAVQAANCVKGVQAPISIPVRNVSLAGNHVRRRLEFSIGNSPQNLALAVSGNNNNTVLYDESGQCSSISLAQCTSERGGAFVESASSTWVSTSLSKLISQDSYVTSNYLAGQDTVTLSSALQLKNFPVTIARDSTIDGSQLGLGPKSDFLTALRSVGAIASNSWSLFWGETGTDPTHQMDGALVLGGIDRAKTTSKNYTAQLNPSSCVTNLVLPLTDMTMVFPNGQTTSLMSTKGQTTNYCIDPQLPVITMNTAQWENWLLAHPASAGDNRAPGGPNVWGLLYPPSTIFAGDLKLTIDNALEITIPNHQLVQYYFDFNSNGDAVVNGSVRELMIDPLEGINGNDFPKLGMTFLQAAYLNVNYDTNEFTVWQANPTTDVSLVGVGASVEGCATTSAGGSSSTASSRPTSNGISNGSSSGQTSGMSAGSIAGVVIAVLAFIVVVAAVGMYFYLRRRKLARKKKVDPSQSAYFLSPYTQKSELDGQTATSSQYQEIGGGEVQAEKHPAQQRVVMEMPA